MEKEDEQILKMKKKFKKDIGLAANRTPDLSHAKGTLYH